MNQQDGRMSWIEQPKCWVSSVARSYQLPSKDANQWDREPSQTTYIKHDTQKTEKRRIRSTHDSTALGSTDRLLSRFIYRPEDRTTAMEHFLSITKTHNMNNGHSKLTTCQSLTKFYQKIGPQVDMLQRRGSICAYKNHWYLCLFYCLLLLSDSTNFLFLL